MSVGAMGLLGAINAFMAAIVPAAWAATQGSGLGLMGWLGAAVGLTGMALVARKPGDETVLASHRIQVLAAAAAGLLFGLGYICLALPDSASTVAPLLAMRISASILGGSLLVFSRASLWISRDSGKLGYLPGLFGCTSLIAFVVAVHRDAVALTSVLQALAPLGTAGLAYVVLKQSLTRLQAAGFGLAVLATVLLVVD